MREAYFSKISLVPHIPLRQEECIQTDITLGIKSDSLAYFFGARFGRMRRISQGQQGSTGYGSCEIEWVCRHRDQDHQHSGAITHCHDASIVIIVPSAMFLLGRPRSRKNSRVHSMHAYAHARDTTIHKFQIKKAS